MKVDDILSSGKAQLRLVLRDNIQTILNNLETGVRIISVELIDVSPPPVYPHLLKGFQIRGKKSRRSLKV